MSIFVNVSLPCPKCGAGVDFPVSLSVNADRRPDLRQAILDRSFQAETCAACGTRFRMPPELSYFDGGRKQWLLARPGSEVARWPALEAEARVAFERSYGARASAGGQAMGMGLAVRVVFGWPALAEKLLAAEHGLDDVALECLKLLLVRGVPDTPIADDRDLRLVAVEGQTLVLAWLDADSEAAGQVLRVPRALYDSVVADAAGYAELRAELGAGAFVDMNRVLVAAG